MKSQEILNQQQQQQELPSVGSAFWSILKGNSKQISYSDTHNTVYKLCKRGHAEEILNQLSRISKTHFEEILKNMSKEGNSIQDFVGMINQVNESIERIGEVLLYIESNYINDPKRQHNTIKDILNSQFFSILSQDKKVLIRISQLIVQSKINQKQAQVSQIIQLINNLDQKQVFFPQFFYEVYLKQLSAHYQKIFEENYQKMNTKQFFISTTKKFQQERQWIQKNLMRTKGKKLTVQLMKNLYQQSFGQLRKRIYDEKAQDIFTNDTLEFLQLLNEKQDQKQINNFNDWYVSQIGKRLSTLNRKNNDQFLKDFIKLYTEISKYLQSVKKFSIGYKATFYFENWINQDSIQLARRLNTYFQSLVLNNTNQEDCIREFSILFKFLKQKDLFEKQFRRMSALRLIYDNDKSHLQLQNSVIDYMAAQCGQDWVTKLKSLKSSLQQNNSMKLIKDQQFNALIFEDSVWPFQPLKYKPTIPPQLLKLSQNFEKLYLDKFKGRSIEWHPIQGYVILSIRFKENLVQDFKMDTAMATILLNLQALKYKATIKQLLDYTGLKIQDVTDQLSLLQRQKLITLSTTLKQIHPQKTTIELPQTFPQSEPLLDYTHRYLQIQFLEKQQHEQLKSQRKMMVQAFIVKILKSSKPITLAQLYRIITPMIEGRGFKFSEKFVGDTFRGLVDKRFVKEMEDGMVSYLAS